MKVDIVDISADQAESVDQLEELFKIQAELQKKYGYDFETMTMDERIEFLRWNVVALTSEVSEAMNEVGWKPWASAQYIDRDPYVGEMIDVSKFFLNMMLAVGVTPSEFMQRFRGKTKVNHARHENGYTGRDKCSCSRAIDEPTVT